MPDDANVVLEGKKTSLCVCLICRHIIRHIIQIHINQTAAEIFVIKKGQLKFEISHNFSYIDYL